MDKKKILILITKSNWGGAQRYVYDLATRLPKDKYTVEVMAGGNGPLITKLNEAGISADGTLPVGRDVNIFQDTAAFFRLWLILRKRRPDIIHVNSSKIGGLGALAGRLARIKKIIFTAHGWAFKEERSLFSKILIRLSYWATIILSHHVMAVSESAAKEVRNWPFAKDKVSVVHNGIASESLFSQINARHALIAAYPQLKELVPAASDKQTIWLGTIAELHHIKGHADAIKAVADCVKWLERIQPKKKLIYTIFGDGDERSKLETLIRELGMEKNILLLGHLSQAGQYIAAFDIFVLASLSEGLSYVMLEAGLARTAVVATAVGGIPEVIEDMHSGVLVLSKKPAEIAHAIEFLIEHPEIRKTYGTHLKEKVAKDFSLEKMLSAIQGVYEK